MMFHITSSGKEIQSKRTELHLSVLNKNHHFYFPSFFFFLVLDKLLHVGESLIKRKSKSHQLMRV